ncbi:Choline-sulfatase [Planctomycetes bacterium MalM25]|nr:Choline-sulfatase [Planctomycetes bacterium MalM25]
MQRAIELVSIAATLVTSAAIAEQPNVVLILLDDVSHYSVSTYGAEEISCDSPVEPFENVAFSTPRMDSLAREGARCDWAYTYPLCEPSRVALMTGKNNRRNYLYPKSQHASDITFSDLFKRAGYETCIVGKWKQTRGTEGTPAEEYISEFCWDEFFCFDVTNKVGRRMIEPYFILNGDTKDYRGIDPETGRRWYGPQLINRYALDFIERKKAQPFFLYYSMLLMHSERTPTPDTKPASVYDTHDVGNSRRGDDARFYPDMLHYADKMIGNILDKLEEAGVADNTIVVLMGDNGTRPEYFFAYPDGAVRQAYKGKHIEGGLHVPLLIRAPGKIPAKTTYDELVYVTDILPMLCEAAGLEIPNRNHLDGVSFWPQLTGRSKQAPRDAITTWSLNANDDGEHSIVLEYAFDKRFKRYAPDAMYPDGRFFEWAEDLLEESGAPVKKRIPRRTNRYRYAGLDLNGLSSDQQEAYERLGALLEAKRYVPVESLEIITSDDPLRAGSTRALRCEIAPPGATRNSLIWESSDPEVASIDKFGVLHAHQSGDVTVTVYSWDDAEPRANGQSPEYLRVGLNSSVDIAIVE